MQHKFLNLFTSLFSRITNGLLIVFMTPFYIHCLGTEAYGLIGFFNILILFFFLFDFGLGTTLNREVARFSAKKNMVDHLPSLSLSVEAIHGALCILCAICILSLSSFFTTHWLKYQTLSPSEVSTAIFLIALNLLAQGPITLYMNGMLGLQKHVPLNSALVLFSLVKHLGSGLCLTILSSIKVYFLWNLFVSAAQLATTRWMFYHSVRKLTQAKASFDFDLIRKIKRFSLGVSIPAIAGVFATHGHKMILSGLLDLTHLGYYTAVTTFTHMLFCITQPIQTTFFPIFSHSVASQNSPSLKENYHLSCQLIAIAIFPVALIGIAFARPILLLWTQNPQLANWMGPTASILFLEGLFFSIMAMPHKMQLAFGWTSLSATYHSVAAVVVPLFSYICVGLLHWGIESSAVISAILGLAYCCFGSWIMFQRILGDEARHWAVEDILKPLAVASCIIALSYSFLPSEEIAQWFFLFIVWAITTTAGAMISNKIWPRISNYIRI